jgi:hypothetical protein
MTHDEQLKFVAELIDGVKLNLLANHEKWPAEWSGVELRALIGSAFAHCNAEELQQRYGSRVRAAMDEINTL